jgi:hypothetical protein
MITFRITTEIKDDRRVVLTLPSEVPTGQAELEVSVGFPAAEKARTSQADWLEVQAGMNGLGQARYPLRGSVIRYEQPTEPVAEGEWEALR